MPRKRPDSRLVILAGGNSNVREEAEAHPYDPNGPGAPRLTGMPPAGMRRSANAIPSTGSATAQQSVAMTPIYYDYRFSTPDKYYFPKDRFNANATWRDIYRRDATIAIATDLYAELPWSEFDIEKINDHKIRQIYEDMFTDLDLVSNLPAYTKDFLITGELIMHSLFNKKKGYWDRAISHSADYVRIVGTGLAAEQPLMWLRVTPEFQKMLALSSDPIVRKYLSSIPANIIRAFKENKEVHLDPLNTTFIPRINTSQDIRGTSIYTRLFRINMYEDFVMNASLSIAQRNAAPLRMFKVGDVSRPDGWIPNADDIQALSDLLSISETDPFAALITHPYITVDYVGVSDKVLLISREWEFIERVKLLGLGISKAFLMGESSFASSVAGLQVLLERLNSLRQLITNKWIINKLCQTVAEMNDFHEVSQSELANRIRIKKKTERRLIVPNLKWRKSLQPTEDQSLMSTWRDFKEKGLISNRTYLGGGGVDIEVERRNLIEEQKYQQELQERGLTPPAAEGEEPGGVGGGSLLAPPPPEGNELGASKLRLAAAKIFANPYCNGDEIDTGPRMSTDQAVDKLKRMSPKERKQILEHIHRKVRRPNPALLSGKKTN